MICSNIIIILLFPIPLPWDSDPNAFLCPGGLEGAPDPLSSLHIHIHLPVDALGSSSELSGQTGRPPLAVRPRPPKNRSLLPAVRLFLGDKLILGGKSRPTGRSLGKSSKRRRSESTTTTKQPLKDMHDEEGEKGQDYADFGPLESVRI